MVRWFAELQGDRAELILWEGEFPLYGSPSIQEFLVPDSKGANRTVLGITTPEFEMEEDISCVRSQAVKMFDEMKGVILCHNGWTRRSDSVQLGAIYKMSRTGRFLGHYFFDLQGIVAPAVRVRGEATIVRSNSDCNPVIVKATKGQQILARNDAGEKAALTYIGRAGASDWVSLYKAFEALGNQDGLKARGISAVDRHRFVQSSSPHRHHNRMPQDHPPMSFEEARQMLADAIRTGIKRSSKQTE